MEYEKTLVYMTVERFSDKKSLEIRKRLVEHTLQKENTENLVKELEHINKKLEYFYEKDRIKLEKIRNQKRVSE